MTESSSPIFREIAHNSQEYRTACELRDAVLRRPLGLSLFDEDLDRESHQWHFGLFTEKGYLLGCVVALPMPGRAVRVRQMAVVPDFQRRGLGRRIMQELEQELVARGIRRAILHARASAVAFYQKLGYQITGDPFEEIGLTHYPMAKNLVEDTDQFAPCADDLPKGRPN